MFKMRKEVPAMVSDLDKLLAETVSFKLHGKMHYIRPLTNVQFWKYQQALHELFSNSSENASPEVLVDKYHTLIKQVCDTITKKDIEACSLQQVSALFKLVVDTVTGAEKKKII